MKRTTITIAMLISMLTLLTPVVSLARAAGGSRAEDEAAIRKNVMRMQDGWNAGDGDAFAAPFAEDADYVIINGMRVKGRKAIAEGHRQIFSTIYKNSHNAATIESVRFLRDDVAVAHVRWHLKHQAGEGNARATLVMTKDKGKWSIVAFQNTGIASAQK